MDEDVFPGYVLLYEEQKIKDELAIFWNLMALFAQLEETIPKAKKIIKIPDGKTHWLAIIDKPIRALGVREWDFLEVETEIIELKHWYWQWHDSTGPWRIIGIWWGYGEKSKTLVYNDSHELPIHMWPHNLNIEKLERDHEYWRVYKVFRETEKYYYYD